MVDELADPKDADAPAFHVVVPSLPGFGYSDKPTTTGWGTEKIAAAWVELMGRLGYGRFAAHGGDWGGNITTVLGGRFPAHVLGIHTTFAEWSDTEDSPFETISMDSVLDDVTLYWLTRTGASAARIYYESHNSLDPELRVDVPSAITMYPRDVEKCPRPWAQERYRRIVRWGSPETGGRFPSLEVPEGFVEDLREGLAAVLAADR